jgi:hypothetical protein
MNLDELRDALGAHDPSPNAVLAELGRKRRRGRQRMAAASGGLAVVVVIAVVVGAIAARMSTGTPTAASYSASGAGGAASVPAASPAERGSGVAGPNGADRTAPLPGSSVRQGSPQLGPQGAQGSCAAVPLQAAIASAVRGGASVIVATGALTGKSASGNPATAGAPAFYAMTLSSVRTLRGPAIASGSTAWIPGAAAGTASSVSSALLAPGGQLFAIVSPRAVTHDLVGPTLRLAPIVGGDVVFTPSGCWDLTGLQPSQYQAATPLRPVPSGALVNAASQPAESGLYTLPLATVEQIVAKA